jgi:glycosyltransferase involved in cell wall biosynthesis
MIGHGRLLKAGTQPNRLYEYMAAGLPVLAPAYDEGIAPVISAERCGVLADFEDPASIADAIVRLQANPEMCRDMGRRAREAFLARHNWEGEVAPLLETFRTWFPDRRHASALRST